MDAQQRMEIRAEIYLDACLFSARANRDYLSMAIRMNEIRAPEDALTVAMVAECMEDE